MNLEQLKKNIGWRVQLARPAIHLDALGRELPSRNEDWIIRSVDATEVRIDEATELGLTTVLGADIVHRFDTNRSRIPGGLQYGFLILSQQMSIQQDKITFAPCSRPGERVPPAAVTIVEKWVNLSYLTDSGLECTISRNGPARFRVNGPTLHGLPAEPRFESSTRPFSLRQVF